MSYTYCTHSYTEFQQRVPLIESNALQIMSAMSVGTDWTLDFYEEMDNEWFTLSIHRPNSELGEYDVIEMQGDIKTAKFVSIQLHEEE